MSNGRSDKGGWEESGDVNEQSTHHVFVLIIYGPFWMLVSIIPKIRYIITILNILFMCNWTLASVDFLFDIAKHPNTRTHKYGQTSKCHASTNEQAMKENTHFWRVYCRKNYVMRELWLRIRHRRKPGKQQNTVHWGTLLEGCFKNTAVAIIYCDATSTPGHIHTQRRRICVCVYCGNMALTICQANGIKTQLYFIP